jgi:hypothetical protein
MTRSKHPAFQLLLDALCLCCPALRQSAAAGPRTVLDTLPCLCGCGAPGALLLLGHTGAPRPLVACCCWGLPGAMSIPPVRCLHACISAPFHALLADGGALPSGLCYSIYAGKGCNNGRVVCGPASRPLPHMPRLYAVHQLLWFPCSLGRARAAEPSRQALTHCVGMSAKQMGVRPARACFGAFVAWCCAGAKQHCLF